MECGTNDVVQSLYFRVVQPKCLLTHRFTWSLHFSIVRFFHLFVIVRFFASSFIACFFPVHSFANLYASTLVCSFTHFVSSLAPSFTTSFVLLFVYSFVSLYMPKRTNFVVCLFACSIVCLSVPFVRWFVSPFVPLFVCSDLARLFLCLFVSLL